MIDPPKTITDTHFILVDLGVVCVCVGVCVGVGVWGWLDMRVEAWEEEEEEEDKEEEGKGEEEEEDKEDEGEGEDGVESTESLIIFEYSQAISAAIFALFNTRATLASREDPGSKR